MISSVDLDAMEATALAAMPDTCQIQRKSIASDGIGGQSETWSVIATSACRLAPFSRRDNEKVIAAAVRPESKWVATLPTTVDVTAADRIVVGARTFEVVGSRVGSWEISQRLMCVEVG